VSRMIRRKGRASLGKFEVPLDRFQTGAYTAIQRFGSALSLNIHFHSLFFEGAYLLPEAGEEKPEFLKMKSPSNEEMAKLLLKIVQKIKAYLIKARFMNSEGDLLLDEDKSEGILSKLQLASAQNLIATGKRSGKKVRLIKNELLLRDIKISSSRCVEVFGFSLHANVDIGAKSRGELEKLIRYFTRPPVAEQRLHRSDNSEIFLEFKSSWRDGTIGIKFTPLECLDIERFQKQNSNGVFSISR
ncbi:MAG: transposase, partial [Bdellovibrionia bacterium]